MVCPQIFRGIVSILVLFIGISCTAYRTVQIEVLQPAAIPVKPNSRIALFDRNIRDANNALRFSDPLIENNLLKEFGNGLNYRFTDVGYDTVLLLSNADRIEWKEEKQSPILPIDTVRNFGERWGIDYLLSIDLLSYRSVRDEIICRWMLRLYEQGEVLSCDSVTIEKSIPFDPENTDALLDELAVAFWDGGADYARRIVPSWVQTVRRVYRQGKVLALGAAYMKEGKVEEATTLWDQTRGFSDKKAVQACINLAWVYESSGAFEQAHSYLLEAAKTVERVKVGDKLKAYLQEYTRIIEARIRQQALMDTQMNTVEN